MPKFSETFTEQQRAAVVADALAIGNNREAWRRAREGRLTAGLEPFAIGYTYVCELVNEEKLRRDPEGTAARGKGAAELADDIMRRELRRLDGKSRANRLDPVKARDMLRLCKELDTIARKPATGNGNSGQVDDTPAPAEPEPGILERLTQEARTTVPEQSDDGETRDVGSEGSDDTAGRETQPDRSAEREVSAVRSRAENLSRLAAGV